MVACSFIYIPAKPVFPAGSQQLLTQAVAPADTTSTGQTLVAQHQPICDGPSLTHSPTIDSRENEPITELGTSCEPYSCMLLYIYLDRFCTITLDW